MRAHFAHIKVALVLEHARALYAHGCSGQLSLTGTDEQSQVWCPRTVFKCLKKTFLLFVVATGARPHLISSVCSHSQLNPVIYNGERKKLIRGI